MLMQNFGVTNKEYYGMLWYFLEWSITFLELNGNELLIIREAPKKYELRNEKSGLTLTLTLLFSHRF